MLTCSLESMVKLPAVGFMQATYWVLWISFRVNLARSYQWLWSMCCLIKVWGCTVKYLSTCHKSITGKNKSA